MEHMKKPEIDSHKYSKLLFTIGAKEIQLKKDYIFNKCYRNNWRSENTNVDTNLTSLNKNYFKINHILKCKMQNCDISGRKEEKMYVTLGLVINFYLEHQKYDI